MKTLAAAIGLLTRIPVPAPPDPETAGHATRWFPLVGAGIGGIYAALAWLASPHLPASVVAVLVLITEALVTGALHMDGLADTADGFGGGKNREDILRIMRDPTIGSYGAVAIALLVAFKIAALAALLDRHSALPYLVLAPVLGRWTAAPLSRFLPYARTTNSAPAFVGTLDLVWSTVITAAIISAFGPKRSGRRIARVTSPTVEASMLFAISAVARPMSRAFQIAAGEKPMASASFLSDPKCFEAK